MQDFIIRKLEERDADDISRIQESITKEAGTVDYHRVVEEEAKKEDRVSFVAELDGRVVGFMITYIIHGGFGLEESAWIGLFGVDPKYMGQGIGQRMAKEAFILLKQIGINNVFSSVMWDSTDLLSFFKSLGFDRCEFINLKKVID
ncbi:MAG: GNAT family N-acetyltransferase [Deltaproteobacteria bacterium]|nr:MAG: GNAT family N-acetyltransferase [Deltaproteobacteria bacterium]